MVARFDRYEVVRELGRGGQAVVYEARDIEFDRKVALKVLSGGARTRGAAARLIREAQAVARLRHPNIVSVYGAGDWRGRKYIAMELVEGPALDERASPSGIEVREAVEIAAQLADAAHCAHSHGIVHRDIKSSNVLLAGGVTPKLVDFGFALDEEALSRLTVTGEMMGTPAYMSPEQVRQQVADVDARSDVYSLGAVLYEMLTGRPPFGAGMDVVLFHVIINDDPRPLSDLNADIPRDVETICLKCLRKQPARRYASAADLAADCRRFLTGEPIRARPESLVYLAQRTLRRNAAPIAAAIAGLGALAGLMVLSRARLEDPREKAEGARVEAAQARKAADGAVGEVARLQEELETARAESAEAKKAVESARRGVGEDRAPPPVPRERGAPAGPGTSGGEPAEEVTPGPPPEDAADGKPKTTAPDASSGSVPVRAPVRARGFFVEAESGFFTGGAAGLEGASGGRALGGFARAGWAMLATVVLAEDVSEAEVLFRAGSRPKGSARFYFGVRRRGKISEQIHVACFPADLGPMGWHRCRLGVGLRAGQYTIGVRCLEGGGGGHIDVIGVAPGGTRELPNGLVDGRLEEGGSYVEVTRTEGTSVTELRTGLPDDVRARERAVEKAGDRRDRAATPMLIAALWDDDSKIRRRAATSLGYVGGDDAFFPLVMALSDTDDLVRQNATSSLAGLRRHPVLPHVLEAMKDRSGNVRSAAAQLLGELGDTSAVPVLIQAMKDESSVRRLAALALGKLGDRAAVPALVEALRDESSFVRRLAASALGSIGDRSAIPPIIAALKKEKPTKYSVTICSMLAALARLDARDAVPLIAGYLNSPFSALRSSAAYNLGKFSYRAALPALFARLRIEKQPLVRTSIQQAIIKINRRERAGPRSGR